MELRAQITSLEQEPLPSPTLVTSSSSLFNEHENESEKDKKIERLVLENRELQVMVMNVDRESELRGVEKKWERVVKKCWDYEEGLVNSLEEERKVCSIVPHSLNAQPQAGRQINEATNSLRIVQIREIVNSRDTSFSIYRLKLTCSLLVYRLL
jgi:hypothetical protein